MDPTVVATFEQLVRALMSGDNEVRGAAEKSYHEAKGQPDTLFALIVTLLRSSNDVQVRSMCALLARKTVSAQAPGTTDGSKLVFAVSASVLASFKNELLAHLEAEQEKSIRRKVADAISQLGRELVHKGQWPELLPYMLNCTRSGNAAMHEAALQVFAELAEELSSGMRDQFGVLKEVFQRALAEGESVAVRVGALQALAALLLALENATDRQPFQDLVPLMLQTVSTALNENAEEEARDALEILVELSETQPKFLRRHAGALVHALLQIASAGHLEESTRHLAFECLLTLSEAAPAMARKLEGFPAAVIPLALHMMLQVDGDTPEDLEAWEKAADEEDETEISDFDVGSEALDRFAIALGGKACLPVLLDQVQRLSQSQDWKARHAALMAISQAGEGCAKPLSKQLGAIVTMVVANLGDAHARVRWAAVNTIGQMCTDFGPGLQTSHHAQLLPALAQAMDDSSLRVQGHAASAVINFCEHCSRETLEPYLDGLLGKLLVLLQRNVRHVQEQAVTAVASIADVAEDSFSRFYDTFVPGLLAILQQAQGAEYNMLRGKAMECVSLIGLAVGREKFATHAAAVMEAMIASQHAEHVAPDDPQTALLLQASARICKCLGEAFVPYLPHVIPPLIKSAQTDPELNVTDADGGIVGGDDEEEEEGKESVTVTIPGMGNKRISIRTSALEEKATACSMLSTYAQELRAGFFPYVSQVANVLGELVDFEYMEEVRAAAAGAMPELLLSAALAARQGVPGATPELVSQLAHFALGKLVEQLKEEPDIATLSSILEATSALVDLGGTYEAAALSPQQRTATAEVLAVLFKESWERRAEADKARAAERTGDEDDEDDEDADADEQNVLTSLVEVVGQLLKVYRSAFLEPLHLHLLGYVQALLTPDRPPADRTAALCVFDDIIEHCSDGGASTPYVQQGLPLLLQYACDLSPDVRQAACYGLGVLAEHGGAAYSDDQCREANRTLLGVVRDPASRTEDNESATDNAVSALGKALLHRPGSIAGDDLLSEWLAYLPVQGDKVEAAVVHAQLCTLAERHGQQLLGAQGERAPAIVNVLVRIFLSPDLAESTTRQRATTLLQSMPPHAEGSLAQAQANLPDADRAKLQAALARYATP